jgi:lipid II:glycine glycyltransferase (peptidoglycan interpeptide bridge formation enzyme)
LQDRGWSYSDEQIQFCNTVLLDLTASEDELLAAMKQKSRYNVRLAKRRGVCVSPGQVTDLEALYRIYAETAHRDGFIIRPASYYLDAWRSFLDRGLAHFLLARFKGEIVAGLILFTFGSTAWYMYGASSNRHRRQMPNYLLQWEAIRRAKDAGCLLYDLWGAPEVLEESDPMWGVVRFKLGLGGELARGLGAWDYPASRIGYGVYTKVLPRYLEWRRNRHPAGRSGTGDQRA